MLTPREKATAYLEELEATRLAAIAASEEKAEEAKLIKAPQEGFRRAMEILGTTPYPILTEPEPEKPQRIKRRNISELILNELLFSSEPMTTRQIARAINCRRAFTEKALNRVESSGKIMREEDGRWIILSTGVRIANGKTAIRNGPIKTSGEARQRGTTIS
jgi:hypothetical protein